MVLLAVACAQSQIGDEPRYIPLSSCPPLAQTAVVAKGMPADLIAVCKEQTIPIESGETVTLVQVFYGPASDCPAGCIYQHYLGLFTDGDQVLRDLPLEGVYPRGLESAAWRNPPLNSWRESGCEDVLVETTTKVSKRNGHYGWLLEYAELRCVHLQGAGNLFIYIDEQGNEVWDSSQLTWGEIVPTPVPGSARPPAPPRTNRIAFECGAGGGSSIFVINADGSGLTQLTDSGATEDDPAWSPDGQQIAFLSARDSPDPIFATNTEIYVMDTDGSNQTRLTFNPARDHSPAWSPDGQRIAFVSFDGTNSDIYLMNPDGSGLARLTHLEGWEGDPSWSPDGRRIAFTAEVPADPKYPSNSEIFVMDADGSNWVRLTNNEAQDRNPAWSPNGEKIAFESERDGDLEIYVMNSDGSDQKRLTFRSGYDSNPTWSPYGQWIAFWSNRDRTFEIYMMDTGGLSVSRLTPLMSGCARPAWSP